MKVCGYIELLRYNKGLIRVGLSTPVMLAKVRQKKTAQQTNSDSNHTVPIHVFPSLPRISLSNNLQI